MRPKGAVTLITECRLIFQRQNLFVDSGLPALANLLAGITAGQSITAIGYGSGAATPTASDTTLVGISSYYSEIGTYSFPSPGSVQFNYALQAADFGAVGLNIQELGLFANSDAVGLPAAVGTSNPVWTTGVTRALGAMIGDANGNLQRCTTAGTSGASVPTWATAISATTIDGSAEWTVVALHTAPGPLIARVTVPAFAYTGAANYAGTWTLTF
jgi:hypothetical protein